MNRFWLVIDNWKKCFSVNTFCYFNDIKWFWVRKIIVEEAFLSAVVGISAKVLIKMVGQIQTFSDTPPKNPKNPKITKITVQTISNNPQKNPKNPKITKITVQTISNNPPKKS